MMGSQVLMKILLQAEHIFSALDSKVYFPDLSELDISEILDIWDSRWSTTGKENGKSKMCSVKCVTIMSERALIGYNTQRAPTALAPLRATFPKNRHPAYPYGSPLSIPQHILAP